MVNNPLSCNKTDSSVFFVNVISGTSTPVLVSTSNTFLCAGESATLTAAAATSYSWSTGSTSSVIIISPSVSTNYTLNATDQAGCDAITVFAQLVNNCTGLEESEVKNSGLIIYPNPMNEELIISASSRIKSVRLLNVYSALLLESKVHDPYRFRLNVKSLPEGAYFIQVQYENGFVVSKKIVKQN